MSNRDSYTPQEWSLIHSTPWFVTAGVAAADPSGLIGTFQEATAGAIALADFAAKNPGVELLWALGEDKSLPTGPDPNSVLGQGDSAEQSARFLQAVIVRAKQALSVVVDRGTPEEASGYRQLLKTVAERVANAATEGSVLGFGGVRVSPKEQSFLTALAAALDEADGSTVAASAATPTAPAADSAR